MQANIFSKLHRLKWISYLKAWKFGSLPIWYDRYSTCPAGMKVTLCGAGGNTGQPLSLLLIQCHLLDHLSLYDLQQTSVLELNQVDTKCAAVSYFGRHNLRNALKNSNVVVIMTRIQSDTFESNAPAVIELANQICTVCPMAITIIATEPIQSMLPLVAEIQKVRGIYNPRSLVGCTELHQVRASGILARLLKVPEEDVKVPCVGGASTNTLVPLLSSAVYPGKKLEQNQIEYLTSYIMSQPEAATASSTSLVGAYILAKTITSVVRALQGDRGVLQMMFADHMGQIASECQYFSSEMQLGPSGIEHIKMPQLSDFERCLLFNNVLPEVQSQIMKAVRYVNNVWKAASYQPQPCTTSCKGDQPKSPPAPWCLNQSAYRDKFVNNICQELTKKSSGP